MSTNPKTKTYRRRVLRLARDLALRLSRPYSNTSVMDIIATVDPKATRTMHCEAIKLAIGNCSRSERHCKEEADGYRKARATLQEFQERPSLRVIDGGGP